jgi:acyl carrier protein
MLSDDVRGTIREFMTTQLARRAEDRQIGDHDDVISAGLIDSLGIVQLVSFLESTFHIRIRDDEILPENFASIDVIASFVATTANAANGESRHASR